MNSRKHWLRVSPGYLKCTLVQQALTKDSNGSFFKELKLQMMELLEHIVPNETNDNSVIMSSN